MPAVRSSAVARRAAHGARVRVGRKRIARLLRLTGRAGIGGNTHKKRRKKPDPAPHEDLVQRHSWEC